ncbi:unnamed protein product [Linum tenue]|uniref:Cyclic nucleotide-binding domain-containing protein n=1 Tax=Linum tenue TaxID=586396 RepID=A0AAV0L3D9_9ROSI|nr:unnamed protein product [Linum tenue]
MVKCWNGGNGLLGIRRLCSGGWAPRIFRRREKLVRRWNAFFLVLCGVALLVDPLFLYIPRINSVQNHCVDFDRSLATFSTALRSVVDFLYLIRIHFRFRTAFAAPSSTVSGAVELVEDGSAIARRYLFSFFPVDLVSLLPFPQVLVIVAWFMKKARGSGTLTAITALQLGVSLQLVPRVCRIYQLNQEVIKTSYAIKKGAIARTVMTIFLYVAAAHVIGAFWYSLSIRRQMDCWRAACDSQTSGCVYNAILTCGNDRNSPMNNSSTSVLLEQSCPTGSGVAGGSLQIINYGMFADAINSGVLKSLHFERKLLYCFWWALQSLSTLGQNIKPSLDSTWEICFAIGIFVLGLFLFSLVIAVIQTRILTTTIRMEEMKMKWEDVEKWMSSHFVPQELKRRVRRHEEYRWRRQQGVDFHDLLRSLPKDLRRDMKRHLCLNLIKRVPMLEKLDERRQEEVCERLRPVLYTEGSCIIREGDPLEEMLFIVRGSMESSKSTSAGIFNNEILEGGDFYGDEILKWATLTVASTCNSSLQQRPAVSSSLMKLPVSSRTCITLTEVEAFALSAADLKSSVTNIASELQLKDPIRWRSI